MQLDLHQSSARRHHPVAEEQGPHSVLILPGLDDSGSRHWQSAWSRLPHFRRVEFEDWAAPRLDDWVPRLDRAVRESRRPLVLVAHSLGCITAAWWAALSWGEAYREKVRGALLVAPPDIDNDGIDPRIRGFRPMPQMRLPFPSLLVASENDGYCRLERAEEFAAAWGSDFVNAGHLGHINADSPIGAWSEGLRHLARLSGHNANLLVAELGLRTALA